MKTTLPLSRPRCRHDISILSAVLISFLVVGCLPARGADRAFQILHEFSLLDGGPTGPGSLVQDGDGNFYATSNSGGIDGLGTLFQMTPAGEVSILASLSDTYWLPDEYGFMEGADGIFYGTTYSRNAGNPGVVLKMTPGDVPHLQPAFLCPAEIRPYGKLVQTPDGKLYGTSFDGGDAGAGMVFYFTTNGTFETVVLFNRTNGSNPQCGLILAADGALYGTTTGGGGPVGDAYGTIFRLTTNGVLTTLHTFDYAVDGSRPSGNLLQASDGNFYGTTEFGTNNNGFGTIFKMTPDGTVTTLVNFDGTNGAYPHGDLIQAGDGRIYGRTIEGGDDQHGTLFVLTTNGAFAPFLKFQGTNGAWPWPAMVTGKDGNIYGTAGGGTGDQGIAFRLVPPPVVTTICRANGLVTLTWTSFVAGVYEVEWSTNLSANGWLSVPPAITATGDITVTSLPAPLAGPCFYRVALQPPNH